MNRIFVITGKSSSGKDSIFRELMKEKHDDLNRVIPYTTRPIREGECDGVEYRFSDETVFSRLKSEGKIIEDRSYDTVKGLWRYFTVDDGSFDGEKDVIMIGTLDTVISIRDYFGNRKETIPIYIECDDGERLIRAVNREKKRTDPQYRELCRRFLADDEDFSEEKLKKAGVQIRILNDDLLSCVREVRKHIWT
ncbi:MAG: guanylate kinase [Lachnospiraceae bacterium]|nr:guanylate kinase [Lachnospiraceae bacterium]